MSYTASVLDDDPLGVVEFEALSSSLLVLERTFQTNTIRLYEAHLSTVSSTKNC